MENRSVVRASISEAVEMAATPTDDSMRDSEEQNNGFLNEFDTDIDKVEEPEVKILTFEEKLDELDYAVTRQSLNRDILYNVLGFCTIEHPLNEVEQFIMARPDFAHATLSPYHLIQVLVKHHGLIAIDRDEEGLEVTLERKEGLTEDEIDDLVVVTDYLTTAVGETFHTQHLPEARIAELMADEPSRKETYLELLAFCDEAPRTYMEVTNLLDGREVLKFRNDGTPENIQPSVLLDRLQRAGAVQWDNSWKTTEEGKAYLQKERS